MICMNKLHGGGFFFCRNEPEKTPTESDQTGKWKR